MLLFFEILSKTVQSLIQLEPDRRDVTLHVTIKNSFKQMVRFGGFEPDIS